MTWGWRCSIYRIYQWIGLRDHFNIFQPEKKTICHGKIHGFRLRLSFKPIYRIYDSMDLFLSTMGVDQAQLGRLGVANGVSMGFVINNLIVGCVWTYVNIVINHGKDPKLFQYFSRDCGREHAIKIDRNINAPQVIHHFPIRTGFFNLPHASL